jgi:hypothetical protein
MIGLARWPVFRHKKAGVAGLGRRRLLDAFQAGVEADRKHRSIRSGQALLNRDLG